MSSSRDKSGWTPPGRVPGSEAIARAAATDDVGQEQRDTVKRYLDNAWKHDHRCPICGNDDWLIDNVANVVVRPTSYLRFQQEERAYPLAPVLCRICGYTFFINEKWATGEVNQ